MLNDAVGFSEIYIVCGRTDLRYGIDSLAGVLKSIGIENPATAGTLYLFCGRRSDRIKGLVWEVWIRLDLSWTGLILCLRAMGAL